MNQKEIPGRLIVISLVVLASLYFLAGTFRFFYFKLTTPIPEASEELAEYQQTQDEYREHAIRFGLDIQGGVDVLMSIDVDEILKRQLKQVERALKTEFRSKDIPARIRASAENRTIRIILEDPAADQMVLTVIEGPDFANLFEPFDSELLRQNSELTLQLRDERAREQAQRAVDRTVQLLRERIDALGLMQPSVVVQGMDKIRIQLPGETQPDRALAQITRLAKLEFRLVAENMVRLQDSADPSKIDRHAFEEFNTTGEWEIMPGRLTSTNEAGELVETDQEFVVQRDARVTGEDVEEATPYFGPMGLWEISVTFNRRGMYEFGKLTEENVNRQLAIVLDGVVRSAPNIESAITGGRAQITGGFSQNEATALARVINTGALPVSLEVESSQVIGAKLGTDSIRSGVLALGLGALLIVAFMIAYYGRAGIAAVVGVLINILLILALLAAGRGTLTLSGVGGILLTLGMAVDANVLIYERIREELRAGKRAVDAIVGGFDSAFYTIVDANVTTLITALILLQFGQGSVQGFALTMTFGIFATLFTGLYVTRTLFGWWFEKKHIAPVGKATLFTDPKFDFLSWRRLGYGISVLVIALGFLSIYNHGGLIQGTEFSGGVKLQVDFADDTLGTAAIKRRLADADPALTGVDVVEVLGSESFVVTSKLLGDGEAALQRTEQTLDGALESAFPQGYDVQSRDEIGAEVGGEFTQRAIFSLIFASLGILLYIALRFEFWFGVAAVAALLHDVLVTLGVLTFLNVEVTLEVVAALLVVVGYSINDTIVIFDRVRENARLHMGLPFKRVINMSINDSLNRSIITSVTTLIVVLAMLFFGGPGLYYFGIVLLIGVITGTYSSSFVASPLLAFFASRDDIEMLSAEVEKPAAKRTAEAKGRKAVEQPPKAAPADTAEAAGEDTSKPAEAASAPAATDGDGASGEAKPAKKGKKGKKRKKSASRK